MNKIWRRIYGFFRWYSARKRNGQCFYCGSWSRVKMSLITDEGEVLMRYIECVACGAKTYT